MRHYLFFDSREHDLGHSMSMIFILNTTNIHSEQLTTVMVWGSM